MPRASSLPTALPRRLASCPHLAAALLRWRNAYRLGRPRILALAALCAALAVLVLLAPPAAAVLQWLAGSPVVTFAISGCLFGLSAVRRAELIRSDAATSWLAALPARSSSLLRLVAGAGLGLLAVIVVLGLASGLGRLALAMALRAALFTTAGALAGTLAGARPGRGAAAGATGWHYASVRRARPRWAAAPSLMPLSYWPVAQGRVLSRPKAVRVALFALLAVPAGLRDPGEVALAVGAGCITVFTLVSLSVGAARAAGDAARWLAPTTIRLRAFIGAFTWRVAAKQAAVLAVTIFLTSAVDYPRALWLGGMLAAAYLLISCAALSAACLRASRRVGLGMAGRDA